MGRVLVTGGAGYVGSHAAKALAAAGHEPVVYDSLVHGHDWAVRWGPLEVGDILDSDRLAAVMAQYRPEAVMHFSALSLVAESVADPARYYRNNVAGTLSLLDAMRAAGIDRIVFSSTCAVYGEPEAVPITEDEKLDPINPYGATKLMIERALADYGRAYGLDHVSLRYFNAAGASAQGEIGEAHDPETHLIPLVLDAAAGSRPSITVFGQDYATPDGTCIRDYIHVDDLASAHVAALERLGGLEPAYNLGTGVGVSVAEIIAAAGRVTGREIPVVQGERRPGDPDTLLADPARARRDLAWTPAYIDIEETIRTAWNWHRRNSSRRAQE